MPVLLSDELAKWEMEKQLTTSKIVFWINPVTGIKNLPEYNK